jgi:ATP-binding cassette subfamily C protein
MKKMFYKKLSKNTKFLLLSTKSLDRRERIVILILIFVQVSLSILDLIGVALLGLVGAISISGIQSAKQSNQIGELLKFLNLENFTFQLQVAVLALFAAFILFN